MVLPLGLLLVSAILIYLSCEFFVNGVEWVGRRLGVAQSAVGTVLAAFGTALPESVVTLVAVAFGKSDAQKEIGVGAAIGGPLVLGTLAYAVVGLVFLTSRGERHAGLLAKVDTRKLSRDQMWFIAIFVVKVVLGLVAFAIKPVLGVLFLAAYGFYIWGEMRGGEGASEAEGESGELEPLKFRPRDPAPTTSWALFQTLVAVIVIFLSSRLFVHQLGAIGSGLGVSPQLIALLLSPVATELPEILNAVIWVRQGKVSLALGNISGAMMIQATIPSALGIFFTPWLLSRPLVWAAVITLVAVAAQYVLLRKKALNAVRLSLFALFYLAFAVGLALI